MHDIPDFLDWSSSLHILNQVSDALMVLSLDGHIIAVNEELCRRVGFSRAEVLGGRPSMWITAQDADEFTDQIIEKCLSAGSWRGDVHFSNLDGTKRVSDVSARPLIDETGEPIAILSVSRDITEQRALEEQLRLDQRLKAIGQISGGIAHDFNNILALILGNVELALAQVQDPDVSEVLEIALQGAIRGGRLTHRLLAYARQQPLSPKATDPVLLLKDIDHLVGNSLGEKILVEFITDVDMWRCSADRQQLETVLLNLIINARDAMPEGGKLAIECFNAMLDAAFAGRNQEVEPGDYVCFAITDSGVGMSRSTIERAFDPFFTTKAVGEGSGLGLSMAYGFAKQSKGHISIDSEEGCGTTVKLYLPRSFRPAEAASDRVTPNETFLPVGLRILVVEDEPAVRKTVLNHLLGLKCIVTEAGDAKSAIRECSSGSEFDIFLIDVVLPGEMNGPTLAQELSKNRRETPTVFMSGYMENVSCENIDSLADKIFLHKPFAKRELEAALLKAICQ